MTNSLENSMINSPFPSNVGTWDHVITDPPYSARVHTKAATMRGGWAGKNDLGFEALTPALRADIARAIAAARRWSVVFTDDRGINPWVAAVEGAGGSHIRTIPWVRWSMPQLSGDRPTSGAEYVLIFWGDGKGRKSWNGPGNLTHFSDNCMRGLGKHKTQKPLGLMLKIVEFFTNPGASIIDPCAGRGTTIQAAQVLGRRALGYEIDARECELAAVRLAARDERDAAAIDAHGVYMSEVAAEKARMRATTDRITARRCSVEAGK